MTAVLPTVETAWANEPVRHRRRSIVREFALNTSTHGLPGIARSQSRHNCIFWLISFLIFLGIMIVFVTETIRNYFDYPTQASVSITVERSQPFPAVTFCNYAPARFDRILGPFFNVTNLNDLSYADSFTPEQAVQVFEYLRERFNNNADIDQFFFSLDMMLMNCIYNGAECTKDDFISFLSSQHGRCFTFNARTTNPNQTNLRWTSDNGGTGKLQLRLYTHKQLYIPYVSQDVSAGIVAMVHDNTQLPRIDVEGIELAPGRKHKIGYKKKTTFFLSSPYTQCTNQIPLVMKAMFDRYQGADYSYSQSLCFTLCTQSYIYQECACVSPEEWSARSVVLSGTDTIIEAPLCSMTDVCYYEALRRFSNSTQIWDQFCSNCTQECSNVNFLLTTSSTSAPSAPFAYQTKRFVESTGVPLISNWSSNWLTEVYANYVSLDVVCESTQVENYTQEASIGAVDVLSNVGGHTGLWIGISFLSVMEFVEMLYRILRFEFHAIKNKFQRKKT